MNLTLMKCQNLYPNKLPGASSLDSFGMLMRERTFSSAAYRFGFNGQEKDDEVSGAGNTNTAEFWEYDCRLGRRWSIDPEMKYWEGSYTCFYNNPTNVIDPLGNSGYIDKDGNHIGDDGDQNDHTTRVFNGTKADWNKTVGNKAISDETRKKLLNNSTALTDYTEGIRVSDDAWEMIVKNKGTKLEPWLTNNSDHEVYYKPEEGANSVKVGAKKDIYTRIDGVATPNLKGKENQVFKATNFVRVTITNEKVEWSSTGPLSWSVMQTTGGWKNETWLSEITSNEIVTEVIRDNGYSQSKVGTETEKKVADLGWIELFKSSGIKDADKYRSPHSTKKSRVVFSNHRD